MNSFLYIPLIWIILLLSIAMLSRYKERALSLKDRYFRLMIYSAAFVCAGEGLGIAWLFYISAGILTGFSILYILRSDRQLMSISVILAAAVGGILSRLLDVEYMVSSCASAAILFIYISRLLDKISQDELTGLNNRREFDRYLHGLFGSTESQTAVFLAMIDIDGFKMINDMEGHLAGDNALKEFAGELKKICSMLPGRAFLARYGGDEFVIAGSGCSEDDMAELEEHISKARPKASCGIEYGPAGSYSSPQELIDGADRLMYEEKRSRQDRK